MSFGERAQIPRRAQYEEGDVSGADVPFPPTVDPGTCLEGTVDPLEALDVRLERLYEERIQEQARRLGDGGIRVRAVRDSTEPPTAERS